MEQNLLDEHIKNKNVELAVNGMTPFQILSNTGCSTLNGVLYNDVYNLRSSALISRFKRNEGPHHSAILYIEQCESLHVLITKASPFGVAFQLMLENK